MDAQPQAPDPPASLPDMMTALQRADAAGNAGDARQIAQLISQSYPEHTKALVSAATAPAPSGTLPQPKYSAVTPLPPGAAPPAAPINALANVYGPRPWAGDDPAVAGAPGGPGAPAYQGPAPYQPQTAAQFMQSPQGQQAYPGGLAAPSGPAGPAGAQSWASSSLQGLADFTRTIVNGVPYGLGNTMAGGVAAIADAAQGKPVGGETNQVNALAQQAQQNLPYLGTVGNVIGAGLGFASGGAALEAGAGALAASGVPLVAPLARTAQALAEKLGGSTMGRVALGAGVSGAVGATDALSKGGSLADAATEGLISAIATPVVGKAVDIVAPSAIKLATKSWGLLAGKLAEVNSAAAESEAAAAAVKTGIKPGDLAGKQADAMAANPQGQPAPLAALIPATAQAKLATLASKTPEVGNALSDTADAYAAAGPKELPAALDNAVAGVTHDYSPTGNAGVQSNGEVTQTRTENTTAAMNPIRDTPMSITAADADVLQNPAVRSTMTGYNERNVLTRVNDAVADATEEAPQPGPPSIALRLQQAAADQSMAHAASGAADTRAFLNDVRARVNNDGGLPVSQAQFDAAAKQLHADPNSGFTLQRSPNPVADLFASGKGGPRKAGMINLNGEPMLTAAQDPVALARAKAPPPAPTGTLQLGDLDAIRRELGNRMESPDPVVAKEAASAYPAVSAIARRNPDYDALMNRHALESAYAEGHAHGYAGGALGDTPKSAAALANPATAAAYRQGHASGTLTSLADTASHSEAGAASVAKRLAQDTQLRDTLTQGYGPDVAARLASIGKTTAGAGKVLKTVAPGAPVAHPEDHGAEEHIARGLLSHAVDSTLGLVHNAYSAVKAIFGSKGMSDAGAAKLATMLSSRDPRVQAQAFAAMERAGADAKSMARLTAYISGLGGATTAHNIQGWAGY